MTRVPGTLRYLFVTALVAMLTFGSIAAISAQDATPESATTSIEKAALITPSSITNLGWDQQGADGLTAAAATLGIEALIQENGGYDDITPALKDLADDGAGLIICHASGYQTVCPE
ncbi:MAG: BMP family ABC transporter substrate-binding protein, partial [Thermomicrobiales bacterium]|nr:BMP family ABC transporter substrate-binding protein [Thermomicrobiales bacterium]